MVGKATPGRRGPRGLRLSWGSEKLLIRCGRESPAEGDLGALMSWGPEKLLMRCGRESQVEGALGAPDELGIRDVRDEMW